MALQKKRTVETDKTASNFGKKTPKKVLSKKVYFVFSST